VKNKKELIVQSTRGEQPQSASSAEDPRAWREGQ